MRPPRRWIGPFGILLGLLAAGASARGGAAEKAAEIAKKYQLTIVTGATEFPRGKINGRDAGAPAVDAYLKIFREEWNLYPVELVARTGLKRIILCEGLSFDGQLRAAIPDFPHDDLYLDVSRGSYSASYVRKVLHHEFFHVIDWKDDGALYSDPSWCRLNPDGFAYGRGGAAVQGDSTVSLLDDSVPGFLNKYSRAGVEEDKAELFANLVVNPSEVEKRLDSDRVLERKVERLKALLKTFSPTMDRTFWDAAARGRGAAPAHASRPGA